MPFSSSYSYIDRCLHRFAFNIPFVQKILCDLENDLFKKELKAVDSRHEVFITGLPRSGTTLMLELLYATGEFGTYTYRNMPFVLAPLLWNKLSRAFHKAGQRKERAHLDGMQISFDSPEAFEEVVWLAYLAQKIVRGKTLFTLSADDITDEFSRAFKNSVRKILILAAGARPDSKPPRYLSKNNANLSRINALSRLFPTSSIIVIFRHPLAQISSLAKQHQHFLHEHAMDSFSRQYMEWIGHYEFGENFKPINFLGWLEGEELPQQIDEAFWMRYWNSAYSYALQNRTDKIHFLDFDRLLRDGRESLARISKSLGLRHDRALIDAATTLRSPTTRPVEMNRCPTDVWNRARGIYAELRSLAI